MKWGTLIVAVLISLILVLIVSFTGPGRSISKLTTRVDNLEQLITQLDANNAQLTASLNDALNKQTDYFSVIQGQLTASIQTSTQTVEKNQATALTSLNNDISTVKSLVQNEAAQRSADTTALTNC
jgi:predicted PurR-regulated permease PerM